MRCHECERGSVRRRGGGGLGSIGGAADAGRRAVPHDARHVGDERIDEDASAEIVTLPLLLLGLGVGALASQLGAVTVSAVPDELSPEGGGLQNTATNIGASLGTALAGAVLIATLTSVFLTGIQNNPDVPARVPSQATTELAGGIPFVSDADLEKAL